MEVDWFSQNGGRYRGGLLSKTPVRLWRYTPSFLVYGAIHVAKWILKSTVKRCHLQYLCHVYKRRVLLTDICLKYVSLGMHPLSVAVANIGNRVPIYIKESLLMENATGEGELTSVYIQFFMYIYIICISLYSAYSLDICSTTPLKLNTQTYMHTYIHVFAPTHIAHLPLSFCLIRHETDDEVSWWRFNPGNTLIGICMWPMF